MEPRASHQGQMPQRPGLDTQGLGKAGAVQTGGEQPRRARGAAHPSAPRPRTQVPWPAILSRRLRGPVEMGQRAVTTRPLLPPPEKAEGRCTSGGDQEGQACRAGLLGRARHWGRLSSSPGIFFPVWGLPLGTHPGAPGSHREVLCAHKSLGSSPSAHVSAAF